MVATIEITGTNTRNKGAELLLIAIKQHYATYDGHVRLAASPWFGSFADRASYGLLQKVELMRWGRSRVGFSVLPKSFRSTFGMVTEQEVDAVLDASGFAFGDQHPVTRTVEFADDVQRWKRQGKKVILLPQALGPFENPQIRDGFRRIVEHADLVYARDPVSLAHAEKAVGPSGKLLLAPDITIAVQPCHRHGDVAEAERIAYVVPNARMLDKVSEEEASMYIPFLGRCIAALEACGLFARILLHDANEDQALVTPLQEEVGRQIPVVHESDPLRLKEALGGAQLVIGSRFHSLVGALSQGIPSIAAGWSHKYEMLMRDFGCPGMTLSPIDETARIESMVRQCFDRREKLVAEIKSATQRMSNELDQMWRKVDAVLGIVAN